MDVDRAHAILGVDATTPLGDVRTAYLTRARLLHPDRFHSNGDQLRGEAGRAMADLNRAWEVIEAAGDNRQPATRPVAASAPEPPPKPQLRPAHRGECDLCGSFQARPVTLRRVTGLVLFWRWHRFEAELCRICATVMFREAQAHNITVGWWGIVAPLANLYAILSNLGQHSAIKTWRPPTSRDPFVMTPLPSPPPAAPSLSSRPGPWIGTIAMLGTLLIVIASAASSAITTGSTSTRPSTDSVIGTCVDINGYGVPCTGSTAYWKLTRHGPDCGTAPAVFTDPDTDRTYCAYRN